jgi:NADPH-dependent F420 reductase
MRIAIVGGTGKEGRGLGIRWARKGHEVLVGSRDAARAEERAAEIAAATSGKARGGDNLAMVQEAEIALLSVPFSAHAATLASIAPALQGKILIDITVPLKPPKVSQVHLPEGESCALRAQAALGAGVRVVGALHHVSSVHLADESHALECDVLVCGDDAAAKELVIGLIADLGTRGFDAGALRNSIALESLTPVLIAMNKKYASSGTGIRITGIA